MSTRRPTVSVCCITYNHEQFIIQAIESFLLQQTDFDCEMVIGEDCSTDSTRAVVQEYERRYPGRIRVLTPDVNLGIMSNLIATMAACQGEYIAFLEGDDYWIDSTKLQRQVNTLRANLNCSFCFHDAEIFYETEPFKSTVIFSQHVAAHALPPPTSECVPLLFTQLDLARAGWIAPSASLLFRATSLPRPLPAWFVGVFSGDYTLHLLSARRGAAIYLPRIMSRYRLHKNSITIVSAQSAYQFERRIYEAKMFQQHVFEPQNKIYADIYLSIQCRAYARYLGNAKQRLMQLKYVAKALFYGRQRLVLFAEKFITQKFSQGKL